MACGGGQIYRRILGLMLCHTLYSHYSHPYSASSLNSLRPEDLQHANIDFPHHAIITAPPRSRSIVVRLYIIMFEQHRINLRGPRMKMMMMQPDAMNEEKTETNGQTSYSSVCVLVASWNFQNTFELLSFCSKVGIMMDVKFQVSPRKLLTRSIISFRRSTHINVFI